MRMPTTDPVMAVPDKVPLARPPATAAARDVAPEVVQVHPVGPLPFGLRFAVPPLVPEAGEHSKTYYTVWVKEGTEVSDDGNVVTIQDDVERERED
jgi:hypothetical protein